MIFQYKDQKYEVEIIKKDNKNTYVRIRDNKIIVTTNYFTSERKIKALLEENKKEINKMIERAEKKDQNKELFLLFGKPYDVIYGDFDRDITVEEGKIWVVNEQILLKWLDKFVHTTFYNHLKYWYAEFEERIPDPYLKIRKMKTRWGVCNTKKETVTLNVELLRYDIECLDYVIIHELAHFLVHNHSKQFWSVVAKYCPNYKEIRKKLKD